MTGRSRQTVQTRWAATAHTAH